MKVIRLSNYVRKGDIDILSKSLNSTKLFFLKKNFYYSYYFGNKTGFFMKKLTTKGLINFHIQNKIFFITKNNLVIIDGFEKMILNSKEEYTYMIYMMKIVFENKIKDKYVDMIESHYKVSIDKLNLSKEVSSFIKINNLKVIKQDMRFKFFLKKIKRFKFFFYPRFIAITGLDGSGKSTVVFKLNNIMGHNSRVVYMGKKDWETSLANKFLIKKRLPSFINLLILYFEFYYRFLITFRNTKVILFDRYPSEMYLTQQGIRRKIYYLLFNILFPKPSQIFYLNCSVNTALNRKDDILDLDEYKIRKNLFDNHYFSAIWINTEKNSLSKTIKIIIKKINLKAIELL